MRWQPSLALVLQARPSLKERGSGQTAIVELYQWNFHTSTCDKWVLPRARSSRQSLHTRVCMYMSQRMPVDRATCCDHERAQTTENAKGYVRTHVLRLGECSFLLVGPEIVEHKLRDPTAILCRSCQQDLSAGRTAEHKASCQYSQDIPPNTPKNYLLCSGFRGKQPKVRRALLAGFPKGARTAKAHPFALLTLAQWRHVRTDCIPRAVLQSDWSATVRVVDDLPRGRGEITPDYRWQPCQARMRVGFRIAFSARDRLHKCQRHLNVNACASEGEKGLFFTRPFSPSLAHALTFKWRWHLCSPLSRMRLRVRL